MASFTWPPGSSGGGGGSGTVTEVDTGTGLTGGPITTTGTVALADTAVTPGTYGDVTHVSRITVDQQGRITAASSVAITSAPTVTAVSSNIALANNVIYLVNTSAARSLSLPAPTSGVSFWVKDVTGTAGTNNITITQNASEQIEGVATAAILSTNYGSWRLVADGTNWWII